MPWTQARKGAAQGCGAPGGAEKLPTSRAQSDPCQAETRLQEQGFSGEFSGQGSWVLTAPTTDRDGPEGEPQEEPGVSERQPHTEEQRP